MLFSYLLSSWPLKERSCWNAQSLVSIIAHHFYISFLEVIYRCQFIRPASQMYLHFTIHSPHGFCPLLKNLQTTHTWNFLTFPSFWLRIPSWNSFSQKNLFTPSVSTFKTPRNFWKIFKNEKGQIFRLSTIKPYFFFFLIFNMVYGR